MNLSLRHKFWLFLIVTAFTGLYLFEPFRLPLIDQIMNYKLDIAPLISVKNFVALTLGFLFYRRS